MGCDPMQAHTNKIKKYTIFSSFIKSFYKFILDNYIVLGISKTFLMPIKTAHLDLAIFSQRFFVKTLYICQIVKAFPSARIRILFGFPLPW